MLMSVAATGMTVIFSIVKFINDNNELKEKNRNRELRYTEYLWKKQREIEQAYRQEQEVYRFQYPEVKELCEKVRTYDSRIYERVQSDDDFLTVSVGHSLGATSFRIESKEKQWDAEETPLAEAARAIRQKFSSIDKPKIIDLKKAHLGLVGEKETLHHQIRLIVSQLAFFQSYHDLQIIAVYDAKYEDEFSWMRWLPHTRIQAMNALGMIHSERTRDMILGSMNQILKERRSRLEEGKKEARFMPHYLFLIDEPSLVMDHAIMEYLSMDGNDLGFSIIYTSYLQANLPEVLYKVAREFFDYAAAHEKFYLFMLALFYSGRENEAYKTVAPFIENYYNLIVGIFENAAPQLGNMRGRQKLFAVGFTGILNHHIMTVSYGLSENQKFEISNETTYEIVHQFLYGIYS